MEGREKLHTISNGLKVLQNGRAGRVPRVKYLKRKLNSSIFPFARFGHNRENRENFVDPKNFPSYGSPLIYVECIHGFLIYTQQPHNSCIAYM